jgi:hypothetical protein
VKIFEKTMYFLYLFLFVITFYLSYANYSIKQEVIYVESDVMPEVIVKQVQVPCNASDFNLKCVYNRSDFYYWDTIFPSKQCRNVDYTKLELIKMPWRTGSMRPYMFADDYLLITPYDPKIDLVLGDVVSNGRSLHRIVSINDQTKTYRTKGDNNKEVDFLNSKFEDTEWIVCGVLRGTAE